MTGDAMQEQFSRVSHVAKLRRIALVTAQEARALDADLLPLANALHHAGVEAHIAAWDAAMDWAQFDMLLLRSTWDYISRLREFLSWAERVSRVAPLVNTLPAFRSCRPPSLRPVRMCRMHYSAFWRARIARNS
jgi:hypothetical protein